MTTEKHEFRFFLAVIILLFLGACSPQLDDTSKQKIVEKETISDHPFNPELNNWPHSVSDVLPDPRVVFGRFPNGLRYAILPEEDEKGIVSIQVNVAVGFKDEPIDLYGIAHILEHMNFRGAKGANQKSIIHNFQAQGVGFGFDLNGFTEFDNTHYRINLTSTQQRDVSIALENMGKLVRQPHLSSANLEAEKNVVLAEVKLRNTPELRATQDYQSFLHPNRERLKAPSIGTPESIKKISITDVEAFYSKHYRPDNILIVIAGGVHLQKTESRLRALFSDWKASHNSNLNPTKTEVLDFSKFPKDKNYRENGLKTQVNAVENTASTMQGDIFSFRKKQFTEKMVLSMLRTRLKPRIEDNSDINWINFHKSRTSSYDIRSVKFGAKNYEYAMQYVEEERLRALQFGFTLDEIAFALEKERAYLESMNEQMFPINAWLEANKIRSAFVNGKVNTSATQELENFETFSRSLNADDYQNSAIEMWADFNPRYWAQSSKSMQKRVQDMRGIRNKLLQEEIERPEELTTASFEFPKFDENGRIVSQNSFSKYNIQKLLYDNGTRLNYWRRDIEKDNVEIVVSLTGEFAELSKHYSAIAERVRTLSRADIKGVSKSEMDRMFVGKRTNFQVSMMNSSLIIKSSTRQKDLETALNIIMAFILNHDVSSDSHKENFDRSISRIKTVSKNSPLVSGALRIPNAYSANAPRFQSKSIGSFPLYWNVSNAIQKILNKGAIEVGIVGDFNPKELEKVFSQTFGALPKRDNAKDEDLDPIVHLDPGVSTIMYPGNDEQMALFYCFPGHENAMLETKLATDLGAQVFNNRLLAQFREKLGVSYSTNVISNKNKAFPNFNYMCFSTQFDPSDEIKVHENFLRTLEDFEATPFTKIELKRGREPLVSLLERYGNTNQTYVASIAFAHSNPMLFREYEVSLPTLQKIHLKTLNKTFGSHFKLDKLHVFRVRSYEREKIKEQSSLELGAMLGDSNAQYELGKVLKSLPNDVDRAKAFDWLEAAASDGHRGAHFEIGRTYALEGKYLEKAAHHLKLSGNNTEGKFLLANIYFKNPEKFPDVSESEIMNLYEVSSENGFGAAQAQLAQRYKDGTIVERNETKALKWALISEYRHTKKLSKNSISPFLKRFKEGLSEVEQKKALNEAKQWISNHNLKLRSDKQ